MDFLTTWKISSFFEGEDYASRIVVSNAVIHLSKAALRSLWREVVLEGTVRRPRGRLPDVHRKSTTETIRSSEILPLFCPFITRSD